MKLWSASRVALLGCLAVVVIGTAALAGEEKDNKSANSSKKAPAAMYLVSAPHTAEECLKALDEFNAAGSKTLQAWDFGCSVGDHTGYRMVKATSEEEALSKVPANVREHAKATKLVKYTPAQIAEFHKKM